MGGRLVDSQERSLRARIAAFSMHAAHDPRKTTAAGRAAFRSRFDLLVDPTGVLPPEERKRRADSALRAHMLRLAARSAKARRERKAR